MRTLTLMVILLLVTVFAQAAETSVVSDDYIVLLKKRVEIAEANVHDSDARYTAGVSGYTVADNAREHLVLAKAKINLYHATGEKTKQLNALEEQLKWANDLHEAVEAMYKSSNATFKACREAELTVYEAEYELKKAKQENTKTNTVTELTNSPDMP